MRSRKPGFPKIRASISKITRPDSRGVVRRERLFALLQKVESPVILVIGPPGTGKTALISSYIEARKIPCLWYKLDEGDSDPATFFHYMDMSVRNFTGGKKVMPAFTPEHIPAIDVFSRRYFEKIFSLMPVPSMIVLDNYQEVPAEAFFHEVLGRGIREIPEGITMVLISRRRLPASLSRLYAKGLVAVLDWDDLRFTWEESESFIRLKDPGMDSDSLKNIHIDSGGWISGLVLMLEGYRENVKYKKVSVDSSQKVFDYFAYEIFRRLDESRRDFLLRSAFLPVMTAETAERLTGNGQASGILKELSDDNYFTEAYLQEKPVYQYHPLFRAFLLSVAAQVFSHEAFNDLKKNAARVLETAVRIEDAILLFYECREFDDIGRVIRKWAASLAEGGRYQLLKTWLNYLPEDGIAGDPWLLYWLGISNLPFNPEESLNNFKAALELSCSGKDAAAAFMSWAGAVEAVMYSDQGLGQLDAWFSRIGVMMKQFGEFPSSEIEASVTKVMLRSLALRRPVLFFAKWRERGEEILKRGIDLPTRLGLLTSLACFSYSEGDFRNLEITLAALREYSERAEMPPLSRLTIYWLTASYLNVMSRYDEGEKIIVEGLRTAESAGIPLMRYLLLGHQVLMLLKSGREKEAGRCLRRMSSERGALKSWEQSFYYYCAAWEALYRNDIVRAATYSEHCSRFSEQSGNPWMISLSHLLQAHVEFEEENIEAALEEVETARSIGMQSRNDFTLFLSFFVEAYLYLRLERDDYREPLRRCLRTGRTHGYVNPYIYKKDALRLILSRALEDRIEVSYAKDLIRINGILPDDTTVAMEEWPWVLKIHTFGRFGLVKNEKPLHFSDKIQQKPLLLLKSVIAFGGTADIARLTDLIWPEKDGDAARSAFTTTLMRLRRQSGLEELLVVQDRKIFLERTYCWVDAWAFERMLARAIKLWQEGSIESAVQLTARACNLYRGPFLSEEHEPWMVPMQEKLREKFLWGIRKLGLYWEARKETDRALECYRRGREADEFIEEFYQRIMKCHLRAGRRAEAIAEYERCRRVFSALEITPSRDMEALRTEAIKGKKW